MRIAHILWSLLTGGTENLVVDIANIQSKTDDVAIFVINNQVQPYLKAKISERCRVFYINRKPGSKNPCPLVKLNILIRKFNPDIIHSHSARAIYCIKGMKDVPRVRTIHGLNNPTDEYPLYKALYAISNSVRDFTTEQGFESKTVYNGIDVSKLEKAEKNPYNDNKLHFVQVSRLLHHIKGQDIVLQSIAKIKSMGYTNFMFHFIGEGDSHPYLEELARELNIEELVTFEGEVPQDKLYNRLKSFDLLVQASRFEGFGLTIAEAMAAGVPVIVSNIDAQKEIIVNGELGECFENDNSDNLADMIVCFMKNGADSLKTKKAMDYTIKNYNITNTAHNYLEEYQKIIEKP